jgi:DNA-binding transcriptional ArsR family regulator
MLNNLEVKYETASDPLSLIFSALADPTRRAILARLSKGETTVNELAGPFDISLPAISKHLKVLERAGLISRGQKAQWRPCRIEPRSFLEISSWIDKYRQLWDDSLDNLDVYLRKLQEPHADEQRRVSSNK